MTLQFTTEDAREIIESTLAHLEPKYGAEFQTLGSLMIYSIKRTEDGNQFARFTLDSGSHHPGFVIFGEGDELRQNAIDFAPIRAKVYRECLVTLNAYNELNKQDTVTTTPKNKRGKRSRYTQKERDEIVMAWEKTSKDLNSQKLEDFLAERFGDDEETFKPNLAQSTFYTWRNNFYERNPYWMPEIEKQKGKATSTELTMQAQSLAPTDAPKKANWTRDQKLALIGIIIAAIALIVTIAVALFQLGVIQDFMYAATPALTPVIVSPAATP